MGRQFVIVTLLCCLCFVLVTGCAQQEPSRASTAAANGRVLAVGDLTWQDIDALNRATFPDRGMLEGTVRICLSAPTRSAEQKGQVMTV
jgi:hypothetical protein